MGSGRVLLHTSHVDIIVDRSRFREREQLSGIQKIHVPWYRHVCVHAGSPLHRSTSSCKYATTCAHGGVRGILLFQNLPSCFQLCHEGCYHPLVNTDTHLCPTGLYQVQADSAHHTEGGICAGGYDHAKFDTQDKYDDNADVLGNFETISKREREPKSKLKNFSSRLWE